MDARLATTGNLANAPNLLRLDYAYGEMQSNGTIDATKNNGNLARQTITVPTVGSNAGFAAVQNYTYDSLNRLKQATENITPNGGSQSLSWKQTYTFDRYGNRRFDEPNTTTLPKNCGVPQNPTICPEDVARLNPAINPQNNRLSSSGWQYDAAGNTIQDAEGRSFIYDGENKQTEVRNAQNQTIGKYYFDGDGKRVKKVVPSTGETTVFVYDASNKLVAEYSTVVEPQATAKTSYLTQDHLGSPRILTDQTGAVISRRDFLPYGEEIFSPQRTQSLGYTADTIRQKFTGYEREAETDLDFALARMYANKLGRFTTVDPLMASGRTVQPQSWNRYIYCWNNPLVLIDPDGKDVHMLDEKAKQRVLSTLPEELRKQVEKQINKDGFLKKGSLDKIKSKDPNFLDLKAAVNAKGTLEIMTGSKDPRTGEAFFYTSDAEERKQLVDGLIKTGSTPEEAEKEADELMNSPDRVRSMGLGVTLSPTDKGGSPNGNFRVVLSDGTGDASDAPEADMAAISAHEIYGHGLPAMQGRPWKHEFNEPPKPPGPVDSNIKRIEQRTRDMYKKP